MTYKELVLQDELNLAAPLRNQDADAGMIQSVMENQSPIMKAWFVIMIVNMALFLFLIR